MSRQTPPEIKLPRPLRPAHWRTRIATGLVCRALLLASAVISIGWLNPAPNAASDTSATAVPVPDAAPKDGRVANAFAPLPWIQYTVQHDDTLSGIFASLGLNGHDAVQNVDFAQDIKPGDRFAGIYDALYRGGELVDSGDILAAQIQSNGHWYRAIRFQSGHGKAAYYKPDGQRLKHTFLRTPAPFSRVTSGFSLHRHQPTLRQWRAHKGVDYGAPRGTPAYATSNGKVIFVGRKGGYGNTILLQHADRISTLYGHLSRFRR